MTLTVHREGSGADTTTILLRTVSANSSEEQHLASADLDYQSIPTDVITFVPGVLDVNITVVVFDDIFPEDDEQFYIEVSTCLCGQYVCGCSIRPI